MLKNSFAVRHGYRRMANTVVCHAPLSTAHGKAHHQPIYSRPKRKITPAI
jgi:hypothetical protein